MRMRRLAALAAGLAAVPAAASAQTADADARFLFETRLRSETVDQQGFPERAHALTLPTRLGWRSATAYGLQLLVEGEGVAVLDDRYSAPVEPAPGRQRLVVGNSRFVGNVGWRQNEQTFDAVRVSSTALKPVALTWIFADRVQRPLGHEHAQGVWRGDIHFLQVETATPVGRLSGFGLNVDLDNAAAFSSTTVGARLTGSRPASGDRFLTWSAEYAVQTDAGANPADYSLDFQALAVGLQSQRWSVGAGYERFDGDGVSGFQTPLGTGHGFLGWSDVITTTPAFGVRDLFLRGRVGVPVGTRTLRLAAEAHAFHDADGDFELGRELDLSATLPVDSHWSVELKAARFAGDHPAFGDADKGWLTLEYRY